MHALEHRIPPPLVFVALGVAMWIIARLAPAITINHALRVAIAGIFLAGGFASGLAGFSAFGRAKTTIDPMKIEAASTLVTGGIFKYTRNPMYLGLTSLLVGWLVYLAVPGAIIGPIAFVLFITRFQILPEERVLHSIFGEQYDQYQNRVRRWL